MQNLNELLVKKEVIREEILRIISDMRANPRVKEIVKELFNVFPECGAIVMMAAYKGSRGERFVYDFTEVEESVEEGFNDLVTINSKITEHGPNWEPEIMALFNELSEIFPYPIEEEFDWDELELDEKKEVIIYREDV